MSFYQRRRILPRRFRLVLSSVLQTSGLPFSDILTEKEIEEAFESISDEPTQALEDILKDMAEEGEVEVGQENIEDANLDDMLENAGEAPVIRIVNSILIEALRKGASEQLIAASVDPYSSNMSSSAK